MARTDSPTHKENALQPLLPGDMIRLPFDQAYTAAARSHFADYRSRRAEQTLRCSRKNEKLGLSGLSAHDCRHFWATSAALNGTDPLALPQRQ
jgi:integrase